MTTSINLTPNESAVLKAINTSDYSNEFGDAVWTWDVSDFSGVTGKTFSATVSSLSQKGLVESDNAKIKSESCIWLTDLGKTVCQEKGLAGQYQAHTV